MSSRLNGTLVKSKVSLLYNSKLSVNILYAIVNVDGRLLFKEAIRSQNRKDIHYEVEHATMSWVYKLCNILKFVIDGFYDRPFAQQNLVIQWHELVFHITFQACDNFYAVVKPKSVIRIWVKMCVVLHLLTLPWM